MNYKFENFELDADCFELRRDGGRLAVEPQVLSVLMLLVANANRFVGKEEIVEKVWNGRIVSDAAISARIKSARKAIDDDGAQQRLVRTLHGKGFRFVGKVDYAPSAALALVKQPEPDRPSNPVQAGRVTIAVLPFRLMGEAGANTFVADAFADELIFDLSRLRWLFVIARGSSFRFREPLVDFSDVGKTLGVRYCVTGTIAFAGDSVRASVDLVETSTAHVIWADSWTESVERLHEMRREIAARVVAPLEIQIQLHEAQSARLQSPAVMTAWSAYHAGLDRMFCFNRTDNQQARGLFERALDLAPDFARAHAGLSFTRFQNAFLNYVSGREVEIEAAHLSAETALQLDRMDPFCQLNMGRSFWLLGELQESTGWFDRAATISPSYAQAIYSRAWARTLSGDTESGEKDACLALDLSPLDPLRYAMIATRALCEMTQGNHEAAAILAERAALTPGAHRHIAVIAAISAHLAGRTDTERKWVEQVKQSGSDSAGSSFLTSFPFARTATRELVERAICDLRL